MTPGQVAEYWYIGGIKFDWWKFVVKCPARNIHLALPEQDGPTTMTVVKQRIRAIEEYYQGKQHARAGLSDLPYDNEIPFYVAVLPAKGLRPPIEGVVVRELTPEEKMKAPRRKENRRSKRC